MVNSGIRIAVGCNCACRNSDVVLLIDTTGSMAGALATVIEVFIQLRTKFDSPTCRWAVVEYRDLQDEGYESGYIIRQSLTNNYNDVISALEALEAAGGGDIPEAGFWALFNMAIEWTTAIGGSPDFDRHRVCLWMGDAPNSNGWVEKEGESYFYVPRNLVINTLYDAQIKTFPLSAAFDQAAEEDMLPGAGTAIANATGGRVFPEALTNQTALIRALCQALQ